MASTRRGPVYLGFKYRKMRPEDSVAEGPTDTSGNELLLDGGGGVEGHAVQ